MSSTNDPLVSLSESIGALWSLKSGLSAPIHDSETRKLYEASFFPELAEIERSLEVLSSHSDVLTTTIICKIKPWKVKLQLRTDGIVPVRWDDVPNTSYLTDDESTAANLEAVLGRLCNADEVLSLPELVASVAAIRRAKLEPSTEVVVQLDKSQFYNDSGLEGLAILHVKSNNLREAICNTPIVDAIEAFSSIGNGLMILLVGDANGLAEGPNLRVCGRDHWQAGIIYRPMTSIAIERVQSARQFRFEESNWLINETSLTPFHFEITHSTFQHPDICNGLSELSDRLSILYLSDRTYPSDQSIQCEIRGHKHVRVPVGPASCNNTATSSDLGSILRLFSWAYESQSTDKLGIVRQVATLMLSDQPEDNYLLLATKAVEMRSIAVANFRLFLKRSVEQYFDKRLRVSEYLRDFSEEASSAVTKLTGGLVDNLYKTVGVFIGVAIAALLNANYTEVVATIAAALYFVYLLFILVYWMPSVRKGFDELAYQYDKNVRDLADVLTEEELVRLQGDAFSRAKETFENYYQRTQVLYFLGACLAIMLSLFFFART